MKMGPEQAQRIVSGINRGCTAAMGLGGEIPAWLEDVTLREMLLATRIVERINAREKGRAGAGDVTLLCVPDDRLVSAVYTLLHWEPQPACIAHDGRGAAVAVLTVKLSAADADEDGRAANDV